MTDGFLYFPTEYSKIQRFLYSANTTKKMNPNITLVQCRLILELILNSMIDDKGDLIDRISELKNTWRINSDIIKAMSDLRFLGNQGAHTDFVAWTEATRSLKTLFEIMKWYGASKFRLIKDTRFLSDIQLCVANCYEDGIGININAERQIDWLIKSANNGNSLAQRDLGVIYFYGEKVSKDCDKAIKYLEQAADKNSTDAMYFLGCLNLGVDVQIDANPIKAYNLLSKSADKGNLLAEYVLTNYFDFAKSAAIGVSFTPEKDFWRLTHIVEQAYDDNSFYNLVNKVLLRLADCYQYGIGTAKNFEKSFEYCLDASHRGDVDAHYKLAQHYEKGIGVKRCIEKAEKYYLLAALNGHKGAMFKVQKMDYNKLYNFN